jgi:uncharacterized protein YndB with AHSA1/START domain
VGSLHIEQEVTLAAPPARVYQALTDEVSAWWGAPYLIGGRARSLRLEARLGGRFYQEWDAGDGALWAVVSSLRRGEHLELTGPMGMSGSVQGRVRLELHPEGQGTRLTLSHRAIGDVDDQTRASYTKGWTDLLGTRLKAFVEKGERRGLVHPRAGATAARARGRTR